MEKLEKLEPRGLRNNNPLNIRHGRSKWQGTDPKKKDKDFVCYMTKAYGYRAAWKVLRTYHAELQKRRDTFCLHNILMRWAPPSDGNNTEAYLRRVMMLTGIGGYQILPAPDAPDGYQKLLPVIIAMTCVENGIEPEEVPASAILHGWELAFPMRKLKN